MVTNFSARNATRDSASTFITCTFERGRQDNVQLSMKHLSCILPLLLSVALMVGCAGDFPSAGSGSGVTSDSVTSYDPPSVSAPDTTAQDAIERANAQAASDASNAAAQASFIAGMAAAQETMNNANNQAPSN
jgi:hypothetical protein